jgi:hypothetical protein
MNVMPKLIITRGLIKELQKIYVFICELCICQNQSIVLYFHPQNGLGSCKGPNIIG